MTDKKFLKTVKPGSTITYETFSQTKRKVLVEFVEADIKNGRAGFDATVIAGKNKGLEVWGYAEQVVCLNPA